VDKPLERETERERERETSWNRLIPAGP
jgi:hypothetical protein